MRELFPEWMNKAFEGMTMKKILLSNFYGSRHICITLYCILCRQGLKILFPVALHIIDPYHSRGDGMPHNGLNSSKRLTNLLSGPVSLILN